MPIRLESTLSPVHREWEAMPLHSSRIMACHVHAGALGYMLGRSAEGPQAAPQGPQSPSPLSPHQTAEMSQKASDAFDAAAAGGLNNMAELKAVTSDIMSSQSRQDGANRSPSPHMASVEHLSPAANLAMLQACVRSASYVASTKLNLLSIQEVWKLTLKMLHALHGPCRAI